MNLFPCWVATIELLLLEKDSYIQNSIIIDPSIRQLSTRNQMPSALLELLYCLALHNPISFLKIPRQDLKLYIPLIEDHCPGEFPQGMTFVLVHKGHGVPPNQFDIAPTDIDAFLENAQIRQEARPASQDNPDLRQYHQGGPMQQSNIASYQG